jgi:hypothetical protein
MDEVMSPDAVLEAEAEDAMAGDLGDGGTKKGSKGNIDPICNP